MRRCCAIPSAEAKAASASRSSAGTFPPRSRVMPNAVDCSSGSHLAASFDATCALHNSVSAERSPSRRQRSSRASSGSGAGAAVAASEQAGKRPEEGDLLRLADAQARTGNPAGQGATLEKLLFSYPKKEYWAIYLNRLQRKSGFSDRFSLDLMRLKLATGSLAKTDEFMEMSQLALQAGLPAEGKAIVDKGFAAGALGNGAEAERHKRLRDMANKQEAEAKASIATRAEAAAAAKEGNDLVQIGYAYATMGQADKGVTLIEQGIAKGNLKRPEDAKLKLGLAMLQSSKHKAKAVQVLRGVQGNDGAADLGRLWALYAQG